MTIIDIWFKGEENGRGENPMSQAISKSSQKNSIWFHDLGITLSHSWSHPLESSFISFMKNSTCLQSSGVIRLFLTCRIWWGGGPAVFFHFVLSLYLSVRLLSTSSVSADINLQEPCGSPGSISGICSIRHEVPLPKFPAQSHLYSWLLLSQLRGP